jgi:hypothetical protein
MEYDKRHDTRFWWFYAKTGKVILLLFAGFLIVSVILHLLGVIE